MKYLKQIAVIFGVTFLGELMHHFIPLPIPASIYGFTIMIICLCTKIIKLNQVEETGDFLLVIMPIMFIPGGVALVTAWDTLKSIIVPIAVISVVSTFVTMIATGKVTELVMKLDRRHRDE